MSDGASAATSSFGWPLTTTASRITVTTTALVNYSEPQGEVEGCSECNRSDRKPWPIYTVNYHGVEVCAKCLTPMGLPRRAKP